MDRPVLSRTQAAVVGLAAFCLLLVQLFMPGRPYFLGAWHVGLTGLLVLSSLGSLVLASRAWMGLGAQSPVFWQRTFWTLWLLFGASLVPALVFHLAHDHLLVSLRLCAWLILSAVIAFVFLRVFAALRMAPPGARVPVSTPSGLSNVHPS